MDKMKNFILKHNIPVAISILFTGVIFFGFQVFAAPVSNIFRNIMPETTNTYELGTTTKAWLKIYAQSTQFNGINYTWPGTQSGNTCLTTNGSGVLTWGPCGSGGGGSGGGFTFGLGFIYNATTTDQVLIGATATTSAQKLDVEGGGFFSGSLGAGTTSPAMKLGIQGNGLFSGNLFTAGLTATGTLNFTGLSSGQLNSNGGLIYSGATTTFNSPLSYSGGAVSLPQSNGGTNGYLSSTDWGMFNNKVASTSLSGQSPIGYTAATGIITCTTCLTANQSITLSGAVTGTGATAIITSYNGTTTLYGLLSGVGNQLFTATATSPLNYTQVAGLTCTNCLNTANTTNNSGLVALTASNSGSTYTFTTNASSSPSFGQIFATSTATSTFQGGLQILGTGNVCLPNGTCIGATSGTGITSLNGLSGATQTFSANGPLAITSGGTVHTFNASSSPFFGTLFASSTVRFSSLTNGVLVTDAFGNTTASSSLGINVAPGAGGGSGITSLNGLSGASQTFSANGPLNITSAGTVHTFDASSSPYFGRLTASSTAHINTLNLDNALTVANGGTGQTSFTGGNLLYGSFANGISNVATTSITCTGFISCTGFNALGANSTIGITGQLGVANGGTASSTLGGILAGNGTALSSLIVSSPLSYAQSSQTLSLGTVGVANGGTASTTLGGLIYGNGTALGSATISSPLTWNQSTGALACATCLTGNQTITLSGVVTGSGATAITTSYNGTTTLFGLLTGNGNQLISATTTSPLAYTQTGGITCTNCLNTATANGPLAITSSGSSYTFNASSTPYFGGFTATSTININGGLVQYNFPATSTIPNLTINAWSIATSTSVTPVFSINTTAGTGLFIGTTTNVAATGLAVVGRIFSSGMGTANTGDYVCFDTLTGELGQNATACSLSSIRFKTNIKDYSLGLDDLMKLRPVTFYFKPNLGQDTTKQQEGFIAEEVLKVDPLLVSYNKGQVSGLDYPKFVVMITKAVQDLYKEFQTLIARVSGLEDKLNSQQKQIDNLEIRLQKLEKTP